MAKLLQAERKAEINYFCLAVTNTRKIYRRAQRVKPWIRWATEAKDHISFHSCQLRVGKWGYSSHRLTKQQTVGKTLPGLMSFDLNEPILPCNQIGIVEVLQPTWVLLLTMSIPLWQQCTHCLCCKVQIIWNWFSSILHWVRCTKFGLHSHQISLAHYICFSVNSRCVALKACCLWNTTMSPGADKILWGHRAHINCL